MRLINADELKEAMLEESDWWENADVWVAHKVIDKAPTVDLVKHGRWLETSDDNKKRCSVCDRICFIAIYPWFFGMAHYCPSCGAEMESDNE